MMKSTSESGTPLPLPSPHMAALRRYGIPAHNPLIDLPLGNTERAVLSAELRGTPQLLDAESMYRYPDNRALEMVLAGRFGVDPAQVIVTAGADESLDRACRAFLCAGRTLVTALPTFEMMLHYAQLAAATIVTVPWPGAAFPTDAMIAALTPDTHMITVVTPNNPTGAVATAHDLQRLSAAAPHALLVVDMAYGEFTDHDLSAAVLALPNAIMVRTLSKAWGLAGVRLGYSIGRAETINWLRGAGGPYSVPRTSLAVAHARLSVGEPEMKAYVERVKTERRALLDLLPRLGATQVVPSQANFIFARFRDAAWVQDALASLGIGCRAFTDPLLADARRITCPGDQEAFDRLTHALTAALAPQAILFDLDGVLADVSGSYRAAILTTAKAFGVTLHAEEVAAAKAAGSANNDWQLTHRLLAERGASVSLAAVTETFERFYQGDATTPGLRLTETLLGSRDYLLRLGARWPLAMVTGRPRADAERFLREMHIRDCFKVLVCMEDAPLKPDPAPVALALRQLGVGSAWMIGDTPDDVRAARGAHVVPIGIVAPGDDAVRVTSVLTKAGAARVVLDLGGLEELLT